MKLKKIKFLSYLLLAFLVFSSCEKENPNISLQANKWKIVKIKKKGDSRFSIAKKQYVIDIKSDETFTLKLDVNTCDGNYKITGTGKIEFKEIMCTYMCCDSEFGIALAQLIPKMTNYYEKGGYLYFEGEGKIVLKPL